MNKINNMYETDTFVDNYFVSSVQSSGSVYLHVYITNMVRNTSPRQFSHQQHINDFFLFNYCHYAEVTRYIDT